jgi:hypothetical protein
MLLGYSTEGRKYVRAALALPAVLQSDVAHAHALYVGARFADGQGNHAEALKMLEKCSRCGEAIGLLHLGHIDFHVSNDQQARRHFEGCLAIARDIEHLEMESELQRVPMVSVNTVPVALGRGLASRDSTPWTGVEGYYSQAWLTPIRTGLVCNLCIISTTCSGPTQTV